MYKLNKAKGNTMNKQYRITVINELNGATVQSLTNHLEQRIDRLEFNVKSINGKGSAVFKRFEGFIGAQASDIKFEVKAI